MNLEHPEKSAELQPSQDGQTPKANRRKLIQTGLAGAPLLMALKSVPALAADCKQPSGFSASGNLSQNGTCVKYEGAMRSHQVVDKVRLLGKGQIALAPHFGLSDTHNIDARDTVASVSLEREEGISLQWHSRAALD